METPIGEASAAPSQAPEPRQRWRLTYARKAIEGGAAIAGRDYIALWERAMLDSGLPVVLNDAGRPRIAIGAPLPAGSSAHAELADLWLTHRLPAWQVREALQPVLPAGHELVRLEDVWLSAPALAGRVAAARYLVTLDGAVDLSLLATAVDRVLASDRIVRERTKGGAAKPYDLRPLIVGIEAVAAGSSTALRLTTRMHPELGTGRTEEVLDAVAAETRTPLKATAIVRERLILSDELDS